MNENEINEKKKTCALIQELDRTKIGRERREQEQVLFLLEGQSGSVMDRTYTHRVAPTINTYVMRVVR